MRLDDLAHPLRIEQVGIGFRRILGLDQLGVVGDRRERDAPRGEHAIGVFVHGGKELRHVFRHERRQHLGALPHDEVRGVGAVHHVAVIDLVLELLADALEVALRPRALDLHGDAGIPGLEGLGDLLAQGQVDRRVPGELAFLLRRLDQRRRDFSGLRRCRPHRGDERTRGRRCRGGKHMASRQLPRHGHSSASARHCSAGRCSQTAWPTAMLRPGGALTRSSVLSSSMTV